MKLLTESFGPILHVFSTYESRGINSIELYNDGQRWWIVSLMWRAESDKQPLPERYLRSR